MDIRLADETNKRSNGLPVGYRNRTIPVPPRPEATEYFDAGNVRFGVEYRYLNNDLLNAHATSSVEQKRIHDEAVAAAGFQNGGINDRGASIHIFDPESDLEYLRFDIFEEDPHYHYITPGSHHLRVEFDCVADPDFAGWALSRIATRLPEMLSGDPEITHQEVPKSFLGKIDRAAVAAAVPKLRNMYDEACEKGVQRSAELSKAPASA